MRPMHCGCPGHDYAKAKAEPDWTATLPGTFRKDLPAKDAQGVDLPPVRCRFGICAACARLWPRLTDGRVWQAAVVAASRSVLTQAQWDALLVQLGIQFPA